MLKTCYQSTINRIKAIDLKDLKHGFYNVLIFGFLRAIHIWRHQVVSSIFLSSLLHVTTFSRLCVINFSLFFNPYIPRKWWRHKDDPLSRYMNEESCLWCFLIVPIFIGKAKCSKTYSTGQSEEHRYANPTRRNDDSTTRTRPGTPGLGEYPKGPALAHTWQQPEVAQRFIFTRSHDFRRLPLLIRSRVRWGPWKSEYNRINGVIFMKTTKKSSFGRTFFEIYVTKF